MKRKYKPANPKTRKARLELDNYECQLSKLFGIAELSGKPCSEEMEVHHITYERYSEEEVEDLVTVCRRCHDILTDAIRSERYTATRKDLTRRKEYLETPKADPKENKSGKANIHYQRGSTFADAQRAACRPERPIRTPNEENLKQAEEGGFRLRRDGAARILGKPIS